MSAKGVQKLNEMIWEDAPCSDLCMSKEVCVQRKPWRGKWARKEQLVAPTLAGRQMVTRRQLVWASCLEAVTLRRDSFFPRQGWVS